MAYQIIDKQYTTELKKLETQATSRREQIRAEAKKARAEIAKVRPRAIEIPQVPGAVVAAPSIREDLRKACEEIERWEKEQLQVLTTAHLGAMKELGEAKKHAEIETKEAERKAELEAKEFVPEDVVKLTTGEYVSKPEFKKLTTEQQGLLRAVGVEQFNITQEVTAKRERPAVLKQQFEDDLKAGRIPKGSTFGAITTEGYTYTLPPLPAGEQFTLALSEGTVPEGSTFVSDKNGGFEYNLPPASSKEQFDIALKDGTIPAGSTYVGKTPDGGFQYNLPTMAPNAQFTQALSAGDIPKGSTYVGESADGGFEYSLPSLPPKEQFDAALRDGTVPPGSIYIGEKEGGFEYSLPISAKEQFDQSLKTGEIPSDSVYEGEGDRGGFKYTSPSTQEIEYDAYSYGTYIGKKTMLQSEWDKLSDVKRAELTLGRRPTGPEWMAHRLDEAGVDVPWWYMNSFSDVLGWISTYTPGVQKSEVIYKIRNKALVEWETEYPGEIVSEAWQMATEQIIPDLRAMRPHVTVQDLHWSEHLMSAVNIALLTSPKWMPRVVRGVKKVFPRLRARTHPFSEPARARVEYQPYKGTYRPVKTAGPAEAGMSEAQFDRFIKYRVAHPDTTPFGFRALEAFQKEKVMAEVARILKQKPPVKIVPRVRVDPVTTSKDTWEGLWSSFDKQVAAQRAQAAAAALAKQKVSAASIVQQAAANDAMWRAMAEASIARVKPYGFTLTFLDVPFAVPMTSTQLSITTEQLAGTKVLTATQVKTIANAANLTEAQVVIAAKTGTLSKVLSQPVVAARVIAQTQGLTKVQTAALTEVLTKTSTLTQAEIATLTSAQTKVLAEVLTQTETSTKLQTETATMMKLLQAQELAQAQALQQAQMQAHAQALSQALAQGMTQAQAQTAAQAAAATATAVATAVDVATVTQTKPVTKAVTKAVTKTITKTGITKLILPKKPEEKIIEKEEAYPAGTIVWRQGMYWKIIPPPYDLKKPITSDTPPAGVTMLEGTPQETLTFLEGKMPFTDVAFDLGVVDGFIDVKEKQIIFKGYGLETDVGQRLPSPTKGLTLTEAMDREEEVAPHKKKPRRNQQSFSKRRPKRIDFADTGIPDNVKEYRIKLHKAYKGIHVEEPKPISGVIL